MMQCRFLFNDYFRRELDGQTSGWEVVVKAGNNNSDGNIIHTLRDGRLYTSQNFIKQGANDALFYLADNVPFELCDTVGLIKTNLIGAEVAIGQTPREPILAPNHILVSPEDTGAANVFIDATDSVTVGSIGLIYIGCAHEFDAYYPAGWKPPFLREYDTDVMMSDNGLPLCIHRRPMPPEYSVPIRFVHGQGDLQRLQTLLYRMQSENFMFQWNTEDRTSILYCWPTRQGEIEFVSPNTVSVEMKIKGYYDYGN